MSKDNSGDSFGTSSGLSTGPSDLPKLFARARQHARMAAHTFQGAASACRVDGKWHCPQKRGSLIYCY